MSNTGGTERVPSEDGGGAQSHPMNAEQVLRLQREVEQRLGEPTARKSLSVLFGSLVDIREAASALHLQKQFALIQERFQVRLTEAVEQGELPESANVPALSCLAMSLSVGLLECSRAGLNGDELRQAAELAVDHFGFQKETVRTPRNRQQRLS